MPQLGYSTALAPPRRRRQLGVDPASPLAPPPEHNTVETGPLIGPRDIDPMAPADPSLRGTTEFQQLQDVLAPRKVSPWRAVVGSMLGPTVGSVVTGDYQRNRDATALMSKLKLSQGVSNFELGQEKDRAAIGSSQAYAGYMDKLTNAPEVDKEIDTFTDDQMNRVSIMQRPDGSTYEKRSQSKVYDPGKDNLAQAKTVAEMADADRDAARDLAHQDRVAAMDLAHQDRQDALEIRRNPPLSAAARTNVQGKVKNLALAKQQLAGIREAFKNAKGMSVGPWWTGQGFWDTDSGKKLDAAINSYRTTVRQLTRTPGEGAMSDWEGALAQAQVGGDKPRLNRESVLEQYIQQNDDMVTLLDRGYNEMLSGDGGSGGADSGSGNVDLPPAGPGVTPPPGMKLQQNPRTKAYRWAPL